MSAGALVAGEATKNGSALSPIVAQDVLDRAAESLGGALPRIAGALILLVVGLLLVRVVGRLVVRVGLAAGLDRLAERVGVHDVVARAGLERSLTRLIGVAVRIVLAILVVFTALSLSGVELLQESVNEGLLFLPKLVAAVALLLVGLVLAGSVRERVDRAAYQMDLRGPLGLLAQGAIIAVFAIMALAQLGVPTAILTVIAGIAFAACALTFSLAFGLGSRDVAREVTAGRYVNAAFAVGQTVTVAGLRGEIVAIESGACLLASHDGRRLRVPHHMLVDQVVEIESGETGPAEAGAR